MHMRATRFLRQASQLLAVVSLSMAGATGAAESLPVEPEESLARFAVDPGFAVELVAAEPLVRDPVGIDWGFDGKLWVVEMADYPYGIDGEGKPGGRVRFLTDTDGDGRTDRSTLFMEGLSFPTSVMAWGRGVLVTAAPDILYAEDSDGDGRADLREVLFTGFMEGNQQLRLNSLRWGLDGWVYAASGGHHAGFGAQNRIRVGSGPDGREVALGSGDLRFRPDSLNIERLAGPSQFGRVRDDWGNWFGVQNSYPLWHYVLDAEVLNRNPHVTVPDPRKQLRSQQPRVFGNKPSQKRFHGFDHVGRYTSACGPSLYREDWLFPDREGLTRAFTCEPFNNLVQHHRLEKKGVSFEGSRADSTSKTDFLASSDRWCRPVMTRTGPDGALWVVDMYRYMIEHPDWLPEAGREELKPYYRHGEDRGRIYRVVVENQAAKPIPGMAGRDLKGLASFLEDSNGLVRDAAQRLLFERLQDASEHQVEAERAWLLPKLRRMLEDHRLARVRLQVLFTLVGLGWVDDDVRERAVEDSHWAVRRWAVRHGLARPMEGVDDADAAVRLAAAGRLGGTVSEEAGEALLALAERPDLDAYTTAAILSAAPIHFDVLAHSARRLRSQEALLKGLLSTAAAAFPDRADLLTDEAIDVAAPRARDYRLLGHWLDQSPTGAIESRQRWRHLIEKARAVSVDRGANLEFRVAALGLLGRDSDEWDEEQKLLSTCLEPRSPLEIQLGAAGALRRSGKEEGAQLLLDHWQGFSPGVRLSVMDALLSHAPWRTEVVARLKSGSLEACELSLSQRQRLLKQKPEAASWLEMPAARGEALAARSGALEKAGEAGAGKVLFMERCALCHRVGEEGKDIGPDLRALTNRDPEAIFAAILDPNRAVEPLYLAYTATTVNGDVVYGVLKGETGNTVTLAQLDGNERSLRRSDLRSLESSKLSLMPEGLEEGLSDQDLADLIASVQTIR